MVQAWMLLKAPTKNIVQMINSAPVLDAVGISVDAITA